MLCISVSQSFIVIVGHNLDQPPRHGVPGGSNGRIGARPFGARWREWGHHHILLIGQECWRETHRSEEQRDDAGEGEGRWEDRWPPRDTCPRRETVIGCSLSPNTLPQRFYIHFSAHPSRRLSRTCQLSTTNETKGTKVKSCVCMCVFACEVIHLKGFLCQQGANVFIVGWWWTSK